MSLEKWRTQIDDIDAKLIEMLNERASCSRKIGKFKLEQNLPVFHPDREKEIFDRICKSNPGPLPDNSLLTIFRCIIEESRKLQQALDKEGGDVC